MSHRSHPAPPHPATPSSGAPPERPALSAAEINFFISALESVLGATADLAVVKEKIERVAGPLDTDDHIYACEVTGLAFHEVFLAAGSETARSIASRRLEGFPVPRSTAVESDALADVFSRLLGRFLASLPSGKNAALPNPPRRLERADYLDRTRGRSVLAARFRTAAGPLVFAVAY